MGCFVSCSLSYVMLSLHMGCQVFPWDVEHSYGMLEYSYGMSHSYGMFDSCSHLWEVEYSYGK